MRIINANARDIVAWPAPLIGITAAGRSADATVRNLIIAMCPRGCCSGPDALLILGVDFSSALLITEMRSAL